MSYWTYVNGVVGLNTVGRTQHEIEYILNTIVDHLPKVTGSECDMNVHIIKKDGYNCYSSHNEFWQYEKCELQYGYMIVVEGSLRDRMFNETYRELQKWLCRLAKRTQVDDVLIKVEGYDQDYKTVIVTNKGDIYSDMYEIPSWGQHNKKDKDEKNEPAWWEYLMWDKGIDTELPMMLEYKYFNNKRNDAEVERRYKER